MAKKYTVEELWQLYEKIPEELKTAFFSDEITKIIESIGKKYILKEEEVAKIADWIGYVFLGILHPTKFELALKRELFAEKTADAIIAEINAHIFYPLKKELEKLYGEGFFLEKTFSDKKVYPKEGYENDLGQDIYREPIE